MARVFISHASVDDAWADEVHGWLAEKGHEAFTNHSDCDGIELGEAWEQRLYDRLRWTDAVVCLVSSAYRQSGWCSAEIGFARSRGCELLPVFDGETPGHALLASANSTRWAPDSQKAKSALLARLRVLDAAGGWGWEDGRSPFPGLRPFDKDMHRAFFGRSAEIADLVRLLRSPGDPHGRVPLLMIGPSGTGKSSLARAGLAHTLTSQPGWWVLPPVVPGVEPVSALAAALADSAAEVGLAWTTVELRERLDRRDGLHLAAGDILRAAPGPDPRRHLLMIVDQLEELLTQTPAQEKAQFIALLRAATAGPLRVVGTLRTDSLDALLDEPLIAAWGPPETYPLRPLTKDHLRTVITGPADVAGLLVDEELVTTMVEDAGTGDALPLLSFTLARLSDGAGRGDQLTMRRYREIGGVQGALGDQADQALRAACHATGLSPHDVVEAIVDRLVTVDDRARAVARPVARALLTARERDAFQPFVERRLVVTDGREPDASSTATGSLVHGDVVPASDGVTYRVAHESLLSYWEELSDGIRRRVTGLRARREVERAAEQWSTAGTPSAALWDGGHLAGSFEALSASPKRTALRWLLPGKLPPLTTFPEVEATPRKFLALSMRRDRRRAVRLTSILSVLAVGATVLAAFALSQYQAARQQRQVAVARQLVAQAQSLEDRDPATALRLGIAAQSLYPGPETRAPLVNSLLTPYGNSATLTGHTGPVLSVAFSPDATTLATASDDDTVILWDLTDPATPTRIGQPLTGHTGSVSSVAFSPDGTTLATASVGRDGDGDVLLWDLHDPSAPTRIGQPLTGHTGPVSSVAFSPDGTTLATAGFEMVITLHDAGAGAGAHRRRRRRRHPVGPTRPLRTHPHRPTPHRPHGHGVLGHVQPRRHHPGHQRRRRRRHPVGPTRPLRTHPHRPTPPRPHQQGAFGGVQPRRHHPGDRQLRDGHHPPRRRRRRHSVGPPRPLRTHPHRPTPHRPYRPGIHGHVQPRRHHLGHQRRRRRRHPVGPTRPLRTHPHRPTPHRPYRPGIHGHVQPRRHHLGHQRRRHCYPLGPDRHPRPYRAPLH